MTRDQIAASGVALAATSICAMVYSFPPQQYSFYPVCPIYHWTGLLCPGCGATRALHALLHADFTAAFSLNPLLLILLPFVAAFALWQIAGVIRTGKFVAVSLGNRPTFAMVAAVTIFALIRNLT
jgi:Protein of unknown function (DUF2752)